MHRATPNISAIADLLIGAPALSVGYSVLTSIARTSGAFLTSAGLTSILDLMLALVEEDFGSELVLRVAQGLVMFLRRPANQSQFSVPLTGLRRTTRESVMSSPTSRRTRAPT